MRINTLQGVVGALLVALGATASSLYHTLPAPPGKDETDQNMIYSQLRNREVQHSDQAITITYTMKEGVETARHTLAGTPIDEELWNQVELRSLYVREVLRACEHYMGTKLPKRLEVIWAVDGKSYKAMALYCDRAPTQDLR
ncbi:hypothetical protein D3C79_768650 [compost metagenome]